MKLEVTITKARDGIHDYIQVMSEDMVSVNIVFVVDEISLTLSENIPFKMVEISDEK